MTYLELGAPAVALKECADEPIRIPGSIQPHGVLLTLAEPDLTVLQISANSFDVLGLAPAQLLKHSVAVLLDVAQLESLQHAVEDLDSEDNEPLRLKLGDNLFDGLLHRHQGVLILELELNAPVFFDQQRLIARALRRMQAAKTLDALYQVSVSEIQALTGYDRVMIYRFEEDGHGQVIGEALMPGMSPYLGHFFPASDIPPQARELYRANWIRVIPDARYLPAAIQPALCPDTQQPLDLSFAVLRSVSPWHCEYLHNMGVRSSMSISLIKNERLWGLITCGNRQPLTVSHELRTACKSIGQLLSSQISMLEDIDARHQQAQKSVLVDHLVTAMVAAENDVLEGLINNPQQLMALTGATGAAVLIAHQLYVFGDCPSATDIRVLYRWVRHKQQGIFHSANLGAEFSPAQAYQGVASGLLGFTLPKPVDNAVMWFRAEVKATVKWSGKPDKPGSGPHRLHPRLSFEIWKQQVEGMSQRWSSGDLYAVENLRRSALENDLSRQVQREHQAVRERDDLVAVVSHDLRTPMTIITLQCGVMQNMVVVDDSKSSQRMGSAINTMRQATSRMNALLDDLLDTSKLEAGRYSVSLRTTDVQVMLEQICTTLAPLTAVKNIEFSYGTEPNLTIQADPERLFQVFSNLLGNAIKFTPSTGKIEVSAEAANDRVVFRVRDNGVGINPEQLPHVFDRYWANREGNPTGSGLGLYIAHGIVEAHGGRLWVSSEPGQGSTFSFSIPAVR
ncbi:ATP-binding protein [Pseudomonas sp. CCI3.2]|uniref:ATP-binding protein n=1 Tax=unclassified Pseudomonas TaxID=196821 RepID=UPI002AC91189|nr:MULTISPECIES: ATP-binding protein [unclassified Pseudomonas]MEB0076239.1 ATP-binding protein [Pseudomonas sp. MH10out]MEB0090734.1 ATP-binding protein [Pseudomonas sp. CCI4.2]MEB0100588.1 ATP-binding protein [Pseudomonas sp. CCI3.2]MEB0131910.1 ATP-binding protein [Pseudomonas sp. CCI2.4]MEB0157972.1 ATP-binding protein [Pseudomonas sp. AH2 (2023)]